MEDAAAGAGPSSPLRLVLDGHAGADGAGDERRRGAGLEGPTGAEAAQGRTGAAAEAHAAAAAPPAPAAASAPWSKSRRSSGSGTSSPSPSRSASRAR